MGDSSGKAKSSGSSKADLQKKQGQKEANEILRDLGYKTDGQKVFSDTGQVAGEGWSGSRAVDAVRDAAYQVGLQPGGLGSKGSDLEFQQFAAISGKTPEEIKKEREMVSEVYGRDPVRKLGVDKFGQPSSYVATAPTLSELGGDIYRGIVGGTYGSVMRGEPAPEGYRGIGPLIDLLMPGGIIRSIYQGGKEFVTDPIDYTKDLFSGIFSPSATQAVEMNPRTKAYLETFKAPERNKDSEPQQAVVEAAPVEVAPVEEQIPYLGGYDANTMAQLIYPYNSVVVPYEDINNRPIV